MLFKNTLAQSAPLVTSYLFSVALAPIMLARLGLAQFGVWAVAAALASYVGLLDLGLTRSLSRFVALYDAQGDRRAIQECLALGLMGTAVLGVVAGAAAVAAAPLVAHSVHVISVGDMRVLLLSSVAILALGALTAVLAAVPVGMRRMVAPNMAFVAGNVANFVASVVALVVAPQLTTYALSNVAASVFGAVLSVIVLARVWAAPRVAWPRMDRAREILVFAVKGQVIWLGELVNQQTDKIVIAMLVSARAAGAYEIANRVVLAVRSTGILTISAMIPTATAAIVEEGRGFIREFYRRYTGRTVAIAYPLFGIACVSAPFLLMAWLGRSPHDSLLVLVLLSVAYLVNVATGVAMTLATSDGRPGVPAVAAALTSVLNVLATVALAPVFGLWGVLLGTCFALTVGAVVFLIRFHRTYKLPAADFYSSAGPPALLAIGLAVPFGAWYAVAGVHAGDRLTALIGLAASGGTYAVAYWLLAGRLGYLPERLAPQRVWRRLRVRAQPAG